MYRKVYEIAKYIEICRIEERHSMKGESVCKDNEWNMAANSKKILIVDDSEIEREILKNILGDEFEIIEACNGYTGLETILRNEEHLDGILLDVSMPILDGFGVLRIMKENNINHIPVFLITAEATKDNVERAIQYNVSEFLVKPFDSEEVLKRLRNKLGIVKKQVLTDKDMVEINTYISQMEDIYKKYCTNFGEDNEYYVRIAHLMKILLSKYAISNRESELDKSQIEVISRAAYFCDIGKMLIPVQNSGVMKIDEELYQSHTVLGADIMRLNTSKECEYFVQVAADMCIRHHERYDGTGFPNRIYGKSNSVYTQMCRLVDSFDNLFFKYREHNEMQFDFVMSELAKDKGAVSPEIFSLLMECKGNIIIYYNIQE